jgi:hypothetical protein
MFGGFANHGAKLQALVEPIPDFTDQPHIGLTLVVFAVGLPVVAISPALIKSLPSSILYGYVNSPRGGGPEAREPS